MRALLAWFHRTDPTPLPATPVAVPRDLPPLATPPALTQHTAEWFAEEPTAIQALAQATLAALLQARPQPVDAGATRDEGLAWLDEAFARLATLPPPLTPPPQADGLSWRYLVFTRVLSDALDAAYTTAFRRHQPVHCPLTTITDPYRAPRTRVKPHERATLDATGLGALLAGVWLPAAGQQQLLQALSRGIDWVNAAAFWAMDATASTPPLPTEMPTSPSEEDEDTASELAPVSRGDAGPDVASRPDADPATADTTPLSDAFHAAVRALMAGPTFNRQSGDGWSCDGLVWVVAKPFAERLLADPWVQTQPALQHRKILYRRLIAQGLIRAHGAEPVWKMFVSEAGAKPRYASVLKLAGAVAGGPRYAGTVRAASEFTQQVSSRD